MTNHTDLLNAIISKLLSQSYLEIGVQHPDNNFNKIICKKKVGVEPEQYIPGSAWDDRRIYWGKSDSFFSHNPEGTFDVVFIDGLHHADQVKKDIQNAWEILNPGGVIVIHDANPHSESITHVPRDSKEWTGDVYKTVCNVITRPFFTVDMDYGCCVIRKLESSTLLWNDKDYSWKEFDFQRKQLLNLVPIVEAIKIIDAWT